MIIIARQGQSEQSPYHGLRGLSRAVQSGADSIELSIRATSDKRLVLAWSTRLADDKTEPRIKDSSLKELRRRTAGSKQPITVLDDALKAVFGTIMLAITIHESAAVEPLLDALAPFTKRQRAWGAVLFCSSNPLVLRKLRRRAPKAQLALIHGRHTPLVFLAWPTLGLSAVMLHRLSVNSLVIEAAHALDYLVCVYTVDRPKTMSRLEAMGVDAIATNHPDKFV